MIWFSKRTGVGICWPRGEYTTWQHGCLGRAAADRFDLLRHLKPGLGDLQPSFLIERIVSPLGLLAAFVSVSAEFLGAGHRAYATIYSLREASPAF